MTIFIITEILRYCLQRRRQQQQQQQNANGDGDTEFLISTPSREEHHPSCRERLGAALDTFLYKVMLSQLFQQVALLILHLWELEIWIVVIRKCLCICLSTLMVLRWISFLKSWKFHLSPLMPIYDPGLKFDY